MKPELQVAVSHRMWMMGTEFRSYRRTVMLLNIAIYTKFLHNKDHSEQYGN